MQRPGRRLPPSKPGKGTLSPRARVAVFWYLCTFRLLVFVFRFPFLPDFLVLHVSDIWYQEIFGWGWFLQLPRRNRNKIYTNSYNHICCFCFQLAAGCFCFRFGSYQTDGSWPVSCCVRWRVLGNTWIAFLCSRVSIPFHPIPFHPTTYYPIPSAACSCTISYHTITSMYKPSHPISIPSKVGANTIPSHVTESLKKIRLRRTHHPEKIVPSMTTSIQEHARLTRQKQY